jgi:hypothetical protein
MTAEEIDVFLADLNRIGREQARDRRQSQRGKTRPTGARQRRTAGRR